MGDLRAPAVEPIRLARGRLRLEFDLCEERLPDPERLPRGNVLERGLPRMAVDVVLVPQRLPEAGRGERGGRRGDHPPPAGDPEGKVERGPAPPPGPLYQGP